MRLFSFRNVTLAAAATAFLSCAEAPTAPEMVNARVIVPGLTPALVTRPAVVISQLYGAGGNAGAVLRNDYVELFNPGSTPVVMTSWTLAYSSSSGVFGTGNRFTFSGTIQPGGYFLVQLAGGTNGVVLPVTADAAGTSINLSGTTGKIALLSGPVPFAGACPVHEALVDRVSFGNSNCLIDWGNAPAVSTTLAAFRGDNGCAYTGRNDADFTTAAPAPRNSASPAAAACPDAPTGPAIDSVAILSGASTLILGETSNFTAAAYDNDAVVADAVISWASSASTVASVNSAGLVTALAAGQTTITASSGGRSATRTVLVQAAPRVISPIQLQINELMGDPANAAGESFGEWFEVRNTGSEPVDLQGWRIVSGGTQPAHTIASSVIVPAGGYAVLGRDDDVNRNGGLTVNYDYFVGGSTTISLNNNDYLVLLDASQALVDSVSWTTLPRGATKGLRPGVEPVTNADDLAAWGFSSTTFGDGDYGTPGAENTGLADVAPIVSANRITTSGRETADTLPVGFEDQLFATLRAPNGDTVATTRTWSSLTPDIISVDARGVIRGVGTGTGTVRVMAEDGTGRNVRIIVKEFLASNAAYGEAGEFGLPVDADASDDFLVSRREYTSSFSGARGIPNWVAYNLTSDHIVSGQERCDCFTFDPELEAGGFSRYTTADYTGAGAAAGAGIDRGHLARSFDRTVGQLDNARTFYFSNIIPQFSDNNQGPWAQHENYLGDLAENQNKELTIFAGASGSIGTVKNEGRITIPEWTWKVSVIAPRGTRLEDVRDYRDLEVIAVLMPNVSGIRNANWQTEYVVTAAEVEALSGYRFLTALPEKTRRALITGTQPPLATIASASGIEGAPISFSAAGSVDPNGSIVSYAWNFGDGNTGSGIAPTHEYAVFGSYTVQLIATDNDGLADTVSTTIEVARATLEQGAGQLAAAIDNLSASLRNRGEVQSLLAKVRAIEASVARGNENSLLGQLGALKNELDALVQSGRITAAQAQKTYQTILQMQRNASPEP